VIATIHNEPEFSELFMSYLLSRNSRIEEDLIDQLFNSSEKRLARLLLLLANFGKEGRPEPIVGKFSQETLADMIGTTRSRARPDASRNRARHETDGLHRNRPALARQSAVQMIGNAISEVLATDPWHCAQLLSEECPRRVRFTPTN
jgi:hypothetical protein